MPVRIARGIVRCLRAIGRKRPTAANEPTPKTMIWNQIASADRSDHGRGERGQRNRPEEEESRREDLADREENGDDRPDGPSRHAQKTTPQWGCDLS